LSLTGQEARYALLSESSQPVCIMPAAARRGLLGPSSGSSTNGRAHARNAEGSAAAEALAHAIWRIAMMSTRFSAGVVCTAAAFVLATGVLAAAQQGTTPQPAPQQQTKAQEDKGGGFVIGFGGGYGTTNWKEAAYYYTPPCYYYYCPPKVTVPSSHSGFAGNFRIGAAINSRFLILFHSTTTFFNTDTEGTVVDGMAGGDLQVHFGKKGRSFYVFGGAGYQNIMHFSVDNPYSGSNSIGFGVRGGAGFELAKYLTVEGHIQHGYNEAEHNPTSFAVTINFLKR
jgi:hypothetical protein